MPDKRIHPVQGTVLWGRRHRSRLCIPDGCRLVTHGNGSESPGLHSTTHRSVKPDGHAAAPCRRAALPPGSAAAALPTGALTTTATLRELRPECDSQRIKSPAARDVLQMFEDLLMMNTKNPGFSFP